MDKRFWGFLLAVALVLCGVFIFTQTNKAEAPSGNDKGSVTNHTFSKGSTGVTLVEYGDYQCPACGQFYAPVKQVTETYNGKITFQFRNFPLYQIHPNAIAGARAAEAADLQGKYWEMHDMLYENQQSWSQTSDPSAAFAVYAKALGLNVDKFKQDYKGSLVNNRIQADLKEGNRLNVDSTPTFFLDGKKITNPDPTLEAFSKVIDAEIAKKDGSTAATPSPTPTATPEPATAQ
jgi:protein-disulfide isomerase